MFDPARDRYVKSEAERRRFSVSYLLNRKGRNMEKAKKGKNWRFETIQVHTGQEEADESTGARAVPYIRQLLMCSGIRSMQRICSV